MAREPVVYLIAGEPSGDAIAGRLMRALKRQTEGRVRFAGVGGTYMEAEGLRSLFPISELSVMGLVEVLPHAFRILRRMREIATDVRAVAPDVIVSVDSPSFATGVLRKLAAYPAPKVHFVAPTVWAWRPWRVHKFKRLYDRMLAILPFEPPWFEKAGLRCDFVGHPVLEYGADDASVGANFRSRYGIPDAERLICVLPGSRMGEVDRLAPVFGEALRQFAERQGSFRVVIPTVSSVADSVRSHVAAWPGEPLVLPDSAEKHAAMRASNIAIAASGTVTLETALAGVPTVVAYRVAPLTAAIVRRLIKVKYVSIINLLLDKMVVPECLQENCRAERIVQEMERLTGPAGASQIADLQPALDSLGRGGEFPSDRAAALIMEIAEKGVRNRA